MFDRDQLKMPRSEDPDRGDPTNPTEVVINPPIITDPVRGLDPGTGGEVAAGSEGEGSTPE